MSDAWESFIEYLEDLVRRYGLVKILIGLATLAGALLGLGIVVNGETLIRFSGGLIIIVLLFTCLALIIDRRRLYRDNADTVEVLDRYGREIKARLTPEAFSIKEWREEQHLSKGGDTTLCRWFTLVVGPQPVQTFWHRVSMTTPRTDFKYKRKLKVEARTFDENLQIGVRMPTTEMWEQHVVTLFIHLDRAYQPGETVRVFLNIFWPQFNKELIDRNLVDPTEWEFHREVGRFQFMMSFDKSVRIRRNLTITPFPSTPAPTQTRGADDCLRIEFAYDNPPTRTPVGFRVERTQ